MIASLKAGGKRLKVCTRQRQRDREIHFSKGKCPPLKEEERNIDTDSEKATTTGLWCNLDSYCQKKTTSLGRVKITQNSVATSKSQVSLGHRHTCLCTYFLWLIFAKLAEPRTCSGGWVAWKAYWYLLSALYKKKKKIANPWPRAPSIEMVKISIQKVTPRFTHILLARTNHMDPPPPPMQGGWEMEPLAG